MITTFEQHVLQEQQRFPDATTEFTWLVSGITLVLANVPQDVPCRLTSLTLVAPKGLEQRNNLSFTNFMRPLVNVESCSDL